jgi:CBS domain-containing protein
MKVSDVMTHEVERVAASANLKLAAAKMWGGALGAVVVVDEHQHPVGIVTDREIALAAFADGRALAELHVIDFLHEPLVTCFPDDTVVAVAGLMQDRGVRRVVVLDEDGVLVGLVSITDLARAASHGLGLLDGASVLRAVGAVGTH